MAVLILYENTLMNTDTIPQQTTQNSIMSIPVA
jgi:hypothetical protein